MKPVATTEKTDHVVKVGEEVDETEVPVSIITRDDATSVTMVPTISQQVSAKHT